MVLYVSYNIIFVYMKEKKLIAFDLFDTCLELQQPNISYKQLFSDLWIYDRKPELKEILLTSHRSMEDILADFVPDAKIHYFVDIYNKNLHNEIHSAQLFPETEFVLSALKNRWYMIAAISNIGKPYTQVLYNLLPDVFNYEVLSCDIGAKKPDKKIFDVLKRVSWYSSDEMLMVWDHMISDVQWAKNAGIDPIHIDRLSSWIIYHKDYISISALNQLLEIL